jgi:hypothetical protein
VGGTGAGWGRPVETEWAVVVPVFGSLRVIEFGGQFSVLYREIGCDQVELVDLSPVSRTVLGLGATGLCLWVDEDADGRDPVPGCNEWARRVLVAVWGQRAAPRVLGTVVFTGGPDRAGRTLGLSRQAAAALVGLITGS